MSPRIRQSHRSRAGGIFERSLCPLHKYLFIGYQDEPPGEGDRIQSQHHSRPSFVRSRLVSLSLACFITLENPSFQVSQD